MKTSTLSDDFVAELLASSNSKGQYLSCLKEFVESDEAVVNPVEAWPLIFKDKTATALVQSFTNAKTKLNGHGADIKIVNRDGVVFLMHLKRVELRLNPGAEV